MHSYVWRGAYGLICTKEGLDTCMLESGSLMFHREGGAWNLKRSCTNVSLDISNPVLVQFCFTSRLFLRAHGTGEVRSGFHWAKCLSSLCFFSSTQHMYCTVGVLSPENKVQFCWPCLM